MPVVLASTSDRAIRAAVFDAEANLRSVAASGEALIGLAQAGRYDTRLGFLVAEDALPFAAERAAFTDRVRSRLQAHYEEGMRRGY